MPNNVRNLVRFSGSDDDVRSLMNRIQNDDLGYGTIDFDKVIHMPESLNIEDGSIKADALKCYHAKTSYSRYFIGKDILEKYPGKKLEDLRELGRQYLKNKHDYGFMTWHEWRVANWGTKWNAYCQSAKNERNPGLDFATAWCPPHQIISEIARTNPSISIVHEWADENTGVNCGRRRYQNGSLVENYMPERGEEAEKFAYCIMNEPINRRYSYGSEAFD